MWRESSYSTFGKPEAIVIARAAVSGIGSRHKQQLSTKRLADMVKIKTTMMGPHLW